jgi:hypothetical protein
MTWLAVVFFCAAENDCHFWFKETDRPAECHRVLSDAVGIMNKAALPVIYGTCLATKGKGA